MTLEKAANESIFNNVREEFKDMLVAEGITAASEDYSFTIEQLRQKYKCRSDSFCQFRLSRLKSSWIAQKSPWVTMT